MKKHCRTCQYNAYTVAFGKASTIYCVNYKEERKESGMCDQWRMEGWFTCDGCTKTIDNGEVSCGLTGQDPVAYCGRKCDMS
jgi:hypothetical protein